MKNRIQTILHILDKFTGKDGEPNSDLEFYILKSMWVMMLSEFEGSIKGLAEAYIDKVKTLNSDQIHICLLLQNFHHNSEDTLTIDKVISVYKEDPKKITYKHFTRDKKPKNKSSSVEKLFNTLGIFFSDKDQMSLRLLDSIASTRDSIAHGDNQVQITTKELKGRLSDIEDIFNMLNKKTVL